MPPACYRVYSHEGLMHQRQQSQGGRAEQAAAQPDPRPYAPLTPVTPIRTGTTGTEGQSRMNQTWSQGSH
ncbi:unnamed protein product [Rhizoctonia solani]|uniref:Uncharacterized protein n=1 Tax=Rhizoctonia solani TaxID=456999 RepID=A0A8H2WXB2_9AGAM|nr:unnamed protein product [Rhizoctonia solani]